MAVAGCCQRQHTGVSMRHTEVTEFLWLAHHTDLLCPDLQSVGLPASDLALERRAILWRLGRCFSPVVHNFFTTRKCQGWSFVFFKFHPQIFLFCSRVLALGSRSWGTQHPVLSRNTSALSATPSKSICQPNTVIH